MLFAFRVQAITTVEALRKFSTTSGAAAVDDNDDAAGDEEVSWPELLSLF